MSRFRKTSSRKVPDLNTAALPDLIFTLLFFFMIVTHMRPVPVLTEFNVPNANELQNLKEKSQLIYIIVGKESDENLRPAIQLNSSLISFEEFPDKLLELKEIVAPENQQKIVVVLKIDKNTEMGLVNDIRTVLRETDLLTVYYSAEKEFQANRTDTN